MPNTFFHHRGMTLVELLVALVIMVLLFSIAAGAIHSTVKLHGKLENRERQFTRQQAITQFLENQLSGTLPVVMTQSGKKTAFFSGNSNSISFMSKVPQALDNKVFWLIKLEYTDEKSLVLNYAALPVESLSFDFEPDHEPPHLLAKNIEDIEFLYLKKNAATDTALDTEELAEREGQWLEQWNGESGFPAAVKVRMLYPGGSGRLDKTIVLANRHDPKLNQYVFSKDDTF